MNWRAGIPQRARPRGDVEGADNANSIFRRRSAWPGAAILGCRGRSPHAKTVYILHCRNQKRLVHPIKQMSPRHLLVGLCS